MVEVAAGEVAACGFPCVGKVGCFAGDALEIHNKEPIVYDVAIFWVEAIEKVCISFFV